MVFLNISFIHLSFIITSYPTVFQFSVVQERNDGELVGVAAVSCQKHVCCDNRVQSQEHTLYSSVCAGTIRKAVTLQTKEGIKYK